MKHPSIGVCGYMHAREGSKYGIVISHDYRILFV